MAEQSASNCELVINDRLITWTLGDELSVKIIQESYESLQAILKNAKEIDIDLANLTFIDTSGYQLLFSLKRYFDNDNMAIRFSHAQSELMENLKQLGDTELSALLVLPAK